MPACSPGTLETETGNPQDKVAAEGPNQQALGSSEGLST